MRDVYGRRSTEALEAYQSWPTFETFDSHAVREHLQTLKLGVSASTVQCRLGRWRELRKSVDTA